MMQHVVDHVRYAIFRHKLTEDDIEYRTTTGGWTSDFEHAALGSHKEFVLAKAQAISLTPKKFSMTADYITVVMAVDIAIRPQDPLEVVK